MVSGTPAWSRSSIAVEPTYPRASERPDAPAHTSGWQTHKRTQENDVTLNVRAHSGDLCTTPVDHIDGLFKARIPRVPLSLEHPTAKESYTHTRRHKPHAHLVNIAIAQHERPQAQESVIVQGQLELIAHSALAITRDNHREKHKQHHDRAAPGPCACAQT